MTESSTQIWTGDGLTDAEFSAIIERLRNLRQFDLGQYKDRCVRRRIARRLRACKVADFATYLKHLDVDRNELDTLLATISIHVSQFFRNPDTFRIIEQKILPNLCHQARAAGRNKLTLWSAGCATGEEPYSLALMVDDLSADDLEVRVELHPIGSLVAIGDGLAQVGQAPRHRIPVVLLEPSGFDELLDDPLGNHLVMVHGHHRRRFERWWRLAFGA